MKVLDWVRVNKMLVMSVLTVFVLLILHAQGKVSLDENSQALLISSLVVLVLVAAWLIDAVSRRRGTRSTVHRFKTSLCDDLQTYETPFMLRVCSSPLPIADFKERYKQIVEADHYWDWTVYAKSGSNRLNKAMLHEIQAAYLNGAISTSTLGLIRGCWVCDGDLMIVGVVRGMEESPQFVRHPWELGEEQRKSLRALKAYRCWTLPRDDGDLHRIVACRVYGSRSSSSRLLERVLAQIGSVELDSWSFPTRGDWDALDRDAVGAKVESYFAERPPLRLRDLNWNRLRTWLGGADKSAIGLGFAGYMLSPLSPYNDAVVNIAPSYLLARWTAAVLPLGIPLLTAAYYVLSNIVGMILLWGAMRKLTGSVRMRPSWKQAAFAVVWTGLTFAFLSRVDPLELLQSLGVGV